eukprot:TRINITY_DN7312_c0_g2_i3.p1 TRINITY_DN7312_c0_g2~~TRINITY_DN7312_c0_g2_i3.p1  ORF type:complete len:473 (+),score=91.60 TRINITY_DN7312_c0_g2_i3:89-1507(+)
MSMFCQTARDKQMAKKADVPVGECRYRVGGKYRVRCSLDVWEGENLDGKKIARLFAQQDAVLLLQVKEIDGKYHGHVIPQPAFAYSPGWISLEDGFPVVVHCCPSKKPIPPLDFTALPGSWEMKARYTVKNPATVRTSVEIESEFVHEVVPGQEVLILDLGVVDNSQGEPKARLRALVSADDKVGWLSPETAAGDHLLEPVNLLSHQVVGIHKESLRQSKSNGGSGGPRKSFQSDRQIPWQVGGTYRILEKQPARREADLKSKELFNISAGTVVTIKDLRTVDCPTQGSCPMASIEIEEGPEKSKQEGSSVIWVRCTSVKGYDLMDTRDHKEYDKIVNKLRQSIATPLPANSSPADLHAGILATQKKQEPEPVPEETREVSQPEEVPKDVNTNEATEDTDVQQEKVTNPLRDAFEEEKARQNNAGYGTAETMEQQEERKQDSILPPRYDADLMAKLDQYDGEKDDKVFESDR